MKIKDILNGKNSVLFTLGENKTVIDAAKEMIKDGVGSVVVVNKENRPVGIFTERDVLRLVAENGDNLAEILIRDEMSTELIISLPEDNVDDVSALMYEKHLRHLPVVENGKIKGVISVRDVAKAKMDATDFEIHYLRDYIAGKY